MFWKAIASTATSGYLPVLLTTENILHQQFRTTFVVRRKFAPALNKKGGVQKTLRSRHYIYDLVKDTSTETQPNLDVILTTFVDGLGNSGDKVSVKAHNAYHNLLLPGLAVYATPENSKKFKMQESSEKQYSSANAIYTAKMLSTLTLSVVMNAESSWVLKPWHIKASFRKCCYVVPEETITLPETPIQGPDLSLEGKEFFITVTINKTEKVNVRCRLHHWHTNITDRIQYVPDFWKQPMEPILEEQAAILADLPNKGDKISSEKLSKLMRYSL